MLSAELCTRSSSLSPGSAPRPDLRTRCPTSCAPRWMWSDARPLPHSCQTQGFPYTRTRTERAFLAHLGRQSLACNTLLPLLMSRPAKAVIERASRRRPSDALANAFLIPACLALAARTRASVSSACYARPARLAAVRGSVGICACTWRADTCSEQCRGHDAILDCKSRVVGSRCAAEISPEAVCLISAQCPKPPTDSAPFETIARLSGDILNRIASCHLCSI